MLSLPSSAQVDVKDDSLTQRANYTATVGAATDAPVTHPIKPLTEEHKTSLVSGQQGLMGIMQSF